MLHDGRQPWLGGRCCSRNWSRAVFAPEMVQVLPNLTPGPLPFQWPTGHITTATCLQVLACAIIFNIAARPSTEQHHHQGPILEITQIFGFLEFKCYLNELKFLKSHETAQHHHLRALFSRISGPTLHVSLNDFWSPETCQSVWSISFLSITSSLM